MPLDSLPWVSGKITIVKILKSTKQSLKGKSLLQHAIVFLDA
jgi:hypothetical protein